MKIQTEQFKNYIENSNSILLITHKGPDFDAFCSMLITYAIIKEKYPEKIVNMRAKQQPTQNIPFMQEIHVTDNIRDDGEDLVIVTDSSDLGMCLEEGVDDLNPKQLVFLDHHATEIYTEGSLMINELRSSATEQVFATFKDMFSDLQISREVAELLQFGIVSDTGRFLYTNTSPETHRIFADAKEVFPLDLEDTNYKMSKFPKEVTPVVIEYLKTLTITGDMAYMYIDRETIQKNEYVKQGVNEAQSFLRDKYIRFIQGVHWGFIVKPDLDSLNQWFVSFRSTKGYQDVAVIAEELGGGGHKYASGVPMIAETLEEVLTKVLNAVEKYKDQT